MTQTLGILFYILSTAMQWSSILYMYYWLTVDENKGLLALENFTRDDWNELNYEIFDRQSHYKTQTVMRYKKV